MGIEGFLIFGMCLTLALATLLTRALRSGIQTTNKPNFVAVHIRPQAAQGERLHPKGDDTHG
ncbi:MAG: hypothetical protein AAFP28_02680 [Pseudomonadota bacterium]